MTERTSVRLLGAAITLGISWRVLQQTVPNQLDFVIGLGLLLVVLIWLARQGLLQLPASDRPLYLAAALALLGAVLWRDTELLVVSSICCLLGLIALSRPVRQGAASYLLRSSPGDLIQRAVLTARGAATGAWPLLR